MSSRMLVPVTTAAFLGLAVHAHAVILTAAQVAGHAHAAGFRGSGLVNAIATAKLESGYDSDAVGIVDPDDKGLWQINIHYWPQYAPPYPIFDPLKNAQAAYAIAATTQSDCIGATFNWCPWVTFWDSQFFASHPSEIGVNSEAREAAASFDSTVITAVGDRVQACDTMVDIRDTPGGSLLGSQQRGAAGTIRSGPTIAPFDSCGSGRNYYYVWWEIEWDNGLTGWSAEDFLVRVLDPNTVDFSVTFYYVATGTRVWGSNVVTWGPYQTNTVNGTATFNNVHCEINELSITGFWVTDQTFGLISSCSGEEQQRECERGNCGQAASVAGASDGFAPNERVEVYNTGGIGLRAWTSTCSNGYVVKPDGARGTVVDGPVCCDGYDRWRILWDADSASLWSAAGDAATGEYWLRPVGALGACCNPDLHDPFCQATNENDCLAANGGFGGGNTTCPSGCPCSSDAACDWCWIGTNVENNCDTSWDLDGECDCGCQFDDSDCQLTCSENDCTSWAAGGCGSGSCSSTQRRFTRTCSAGCDLPTQKCESDPSCVKQPCEPPEGYEFCIDYDPGGCTVGIALNLYSSVNDIRWGSVVDSNDPFVVGQYQIGWTATDAEKVYYGIDGDACKDGGCDGERVPETGTRVTVVAPGMAHHDGILAYDDTTDWWCVAWFDPYSPNYNNGTDPVYVLRCYNDSDCPPSQRCNKLGNWTNWDCVEQQPDGSSCIQDSDCQSGFCDNDEVGLPDDGWCFAPANTYFDGQEPSYCEYAAGAGSRNCDEKEPGTLLGACLGLSYFEDRCSYTCDEEDLSGVFECFNTDCACNESRCDGLAAGDFIATCANKLPYFADACSSTASGKDRGDDVCRSSTYAAGCTAAQACNGVIAGTGGCSLACQLDPPCVTPGTHRRAVQPDGAQGLDVWITSALSQDSEQGADNDYLQVGGGDDVYYSLVRFNLEGLPPVARKAIVWFYALPASNPVEMYLDRIEGPWDESTRWKDQPSAAFVLTVGAPPVNEWLGLDITHMYNGWKAGYPNWGIRLRPSEAESGFNSFVSSDAPDATLRPILLVLDTCGLGRGDWNCDCDKDLADFAALAVCYSGADSEPAYVSPSLDCLGSFDYDIDNDIDEANWADFASLTGPAH